VTAQLIRAETNETAWSRHSIAIFDVFTVQDEIAVRW
jgi:TolB-like protein